MICVFRVEWRTSLSGIHSSNYNKGFYVYPLSFPVTHFKLMLFLIVVIYVHYHHFHSKKFWQRNISSFVMMSLNLALQKSLKSFVLSEYDDGSGLFVFRSFILMVSPCSLILISVSDF